MKFQQGVKFFTRTRTRAHYRPPMQLPSGEVLMALKGTAILRRGANHRCATDLCRSNPTSAVTLCDRTRSKRSR